MCAGFRAAHQVVKASLLTLDEGHTLPRAILTLPPASFPPIRTAMEEFSHTAAEAARQFGAARSSKLPQHSHSHAGFRRRKRRVTSLGRRWSRGTFDGGGATWAALT